MCNVNCLWTTLSVSVLPWIAYSNKLYSHNISSFLHSISCPPPSSCICPWPPRCLEVSWPRSPFAGTSACLRWCCASQALLQWSLNPSGASLLMIHPSHPCVRSLEVRLGISLYCDKLSRWHLRHFLSCMNSLLVRLSWLMTFRVSGLLG